MCSFMHFYPVYEHNHPICDNIIQNGFEGGDVYYEHFIHGKEEEKQFIFEDHPYTIFLGPKSRVY